MCGRWLPCCSNLKTRLVLTEDKRSEDFSAYADRFSALAPKVYIRKENSDAIEVPAIAVGSNIYFHALPSGKELEPFLNAITQTARPSPPCLSDIKDFEKITLPAQLDLYIALSCGFCPTAVHRLVSLALNCSRIRLSIIDAFL